jgi:hypothetical protein
LGFRLYARDHHGEYPYHTNGFGDALLLLVRSNYTYVAMITAPGTTAVTLRSPSRRETMCRRKGAAGSMSRDFGKRATCNSPWSSTGGRRGEAITDDGPGGRSCARSAWRMVPCFF